MNTLFKDLNAKRLLAQKELAKYNDAIKAMQALCEHKWNCTGHSHNDNRYECTECGEVEYR